jgi:predicted molibdopterin-dependent oxidoreductase YjgC
MADANGMGARDMGALPSMLPGYRPVSDARARDALAVAWGAPVPDAPGLDYAAMTGGGVKALYVMGADPAKRATPAEQEALAKLEFLVAQDLFLTETARLATVVLPAVAYTEKDGTFTSVERRVQVVRKAMLELPGARADWRILTDIANALGLDWSYRNAADILREIARCVPLYAGASRRGLGMSGAQWPLSPGANAAKTSGSAFLTWDMLAQGVARGGRDTTLAASAGGEERAR